MATIPFAFSVHHFINSVGADAGFAAIIGLAILVLLYFAQARETHNLREQAYEATQRVGQLEGRIAQLVRQQTGGTQAPGPVPAPLRATPGAVAAVSAASARMPAPASAYVAAGSAPPGPPAGVAAPALAAATRLIPAVAASPLSASGAAVGPARPASSPLGPPQPATRVVGPPQPVGGVVGPPQPAGATAIGPPQPASLAGVGGSPTKPSIAYARAPGDGATLATPPPVTAAGGANGGGPPAPPTDRAQGRPGGVTPAPRRPFIPPPAEYKVQRSRTSRILAALLAVLVVAAVVVALLIVTSSGGGTSASSSSAAASNAAAAHRGQRATSFRPSSVTVAVLNGTGTSGLARRIATRLGVVGYKQGTVANAADQTSTATIVAYLPGHRSAALRVASALKLGSGAVQPVDASTQQVACPAGAACAANVVVTVGADLASQ
jgi:hypothetical protein